jgi:hypothetical protein
MLICLIGACKTRPKALRHAVAEEVPRSKAEGEEEDMPVRLRKFIGTILLIVLVLVYAWLANSVAVYTLGSAPWWVQFLYFLLTGLIWILPAMLLIKWMAGPKKR